jgi:DNA replication initiation complex subunit (GINS family)
MRLDYDELRRIHRLEKNTSKLVEVDTDFIASLESFVEDEKKKYLASLKNFSSSDAREFANLKRIIDDIFQMREKKILNKALISAHTNDYDDNNMSVEEKETFKKIYKILVEHRGLFLSLFGEAQKESTDLTKLSILSEIPTFVGTDMKEYGPYSEGEEVELPSKVAKLFVLRKLAKEI